MIRTKSRKGPETATLPRQRVGRARLRRLSGLIQDRVFHLLDGKFQPFNPRHTAGLGYPHPSIQLYQVVAVAKAKGLSLSLELANAGGQFVRVSILGSIGADPNLLLYG